MDTHARYMLRFLLLLQVGVAHSGEAASLGVDASDAGPAGPGGLRAFGGSGGAASSAPKAGGMSAAEQKRHADARSELFSQPPPRRDAPAAVSQAAPAAAQAAPSPVGHSMASPSSEAPPAAAPQSEGAEADYDYERAFAAMGGVEEDGDAADAADAEEASAPAAGGAGPPEEDLGLM